MPWAYLKAWYISVGGHVIILIRPEPIMSVNTWRQTFYTEQVTTGIIATFKSF